MDRKPYNKCLINLICSICTGKYLHSVFSHRKTTKTSGKYFPVQTSRSVNRPLIFVKSRFQYYSFRFITKLAKQPFDNMHSYHWLFQKYLVKYIILYLATTTFVIYKWFYIREKKTGT